MEVMAHAERLSALDALFLALEDANDPLHVAITILFEAAPLRGSDGRLDVARITAHFARVLQDVPRFRQRVARVPIFGEPVWIDDAAFDLANHVHAITLPDPGTDAQLRDIVARFQATPIDRSRPLWDVLLIDGVEEERVAVVLKVHHAVVDGVAGIGSLAAILRLQPCDTVEAPASWTPRAAPSGPGLIGDELQQRMLRALRAARGLRTPGVVARDAQRLVHDASKGIASAARVLRHPSPRTSINPPHVGPHRAFDWTSFDLATVKRIGHGAGGTLNDAILAMTAGALHRWLVARGDARNDLAMRVMVPVSTHHHRGDIAGNEVSLVLASLPAEEPDPRVRLSRVVAAMRRAKDSQMSQAISWGEQIADWTTPRLLSIAVRIGMLLRPYNLIVTNIPGPPVPFYLLGARLLSAYPLVPLYGNQAIGIALVSYVDRLFVGVNGDLDRVPDIDQFVRALDESFIELRAVTDSHATAWS